MKKILILALLVAAIVGCQKRGTDDLIVDANKDLIKLSRGPVLSSRVANQGIRVTEFQTGDQIGVTTVFSTEAAPIVPNWAAAMHFDNKPAAFESFTTPTTLFNWGATGAGGEDNCSYPSGKRGIYMVSYYPYSATSYVVGDPEALAPELGEPDARQPKLNIVLTDDMVSYGIGATYTKDNHMKQADILHSVSYTLPGSSVAPFTTPMDFRHVLAQIRFTLECEASVGDSYFRKIEFLTTKSATLNLADGTMVFGANAQDASYTFEFKGDAAPKIPLVGTPYDIFNTTNATKTAFNYPMVLPMTEVVGKKSSLKLYCTTTAAADDVDYKIYTISLYSLKEFMAGKLNTINLTLSKSVDVVLSATIQTWGEGSTSNLPAE